MCDEYSILFIQPSLRYIQLRFILSDYLRIAFQTIITDVPQLHVIIFPDDEEDETLRYIDEDACEIIHALELEHLKRWGRSGNPKVILCQDSITHLSTLPNLVELSLALVENDPKAWRSPEWGSFPSLRILDIYLRIEEPNPAKNNSVAVLASFLEVTQPHTLTHLDIGFMTPPSMSFFPALFDAIGNFTSLKHLSMVVEHGWNFTWPRDHFPGSVLLSWRELVHLTSLELVDVPVKFTLDEFRPLAEAWLELESFIFRTKCASPSGLSLACLQAFSDYGSRNLSSVDVAVDPVAADWTWTPINAYPAYSSRLEHLKLNQSTIAAEAASQVARFLAYVFPFAKLQAHSSEWLPDGTEVVSVMYRIKEAKEQFLRQISSKSYTHWQ